MRATEALRPGAAAGTARVAPFVAYLAFLATGWALGKLAPAADLRWLYAFRIAAAAALLAICWHRYEEFRVRRPTAAQLALSLAAGIAVFVLWINLDLSWATLPGAAAGFDPRWADGGIDWLLASVRVVGAALVVPVMEELFWRSFVMRWVDRQDFLALSPQAVSLRALLASAAAFGFEHQLWFAGIVAGLVYGELYRRSGNLWLPILAHGVTNGALGLWVLRTGNWGFW
jgi:CAAX prenyl protease-like protein